ncbi:MAG: response regulator transcription factor [Bacillota bacterium]|nr:response regulator transcription factor [Bacillota bacterium]
MIKVLVTDDEELIRKSVKLKLDQDGEIEVVATAANGLEAVELCGIHMPDIVLMDIKMPECDGIEATRLITSMYKSIKVIMLTSFIDEPKLRNALNNGAKGYICKDWDSSKIISVVKEPNGNIVMIDKPVIDLLFNHTEEDIQFSEHEKKIMLLILEGMSTENMSAKIFLSQGTIKNIISGLLKKLGLNDRVQLAVYAAKYFTWHEMPKI